MRIISNSMDMYKDDVLPNRDKEDIKLKLGGLGKRQERLKMAYWAHVRRDIKNFTYIFRWWKIKMNVEKESMWTIVVTDILFYVANHNILGLLFHSSLTCGYSY